ncbi:hypothetical protein GC170_12925 [bacterium]|nr:hypothetical protein [bacterium]
MIPTAIQREWFVVLAATFFLTCFIVTSLQEWIEACDEKADIHRLVDQGRRDRVRQDSRLARLFPRLILALEQFDRTRFTKLKAKIRQWLVMAGRGYWTAEEFLAVTQVGTGIATCGCMTFLKVTNLAAPVFIMIAGVLVLTCGFLIEIRKLKAQAEERVETIAFRLPYAVDQISLILAAGGHFQESLGLVLKEMENHPLADELRNVHMAIRRGMHRHEALREMADRLKLPVLDEFVSTIVQGENSGTPLAEIIRIQAEQMRLKRSQMIEAFAARMGVRMAFPGILCMISCLIVIVALFAVWMADVLGSGGGLKI